MERYQARVRSLSAPSTDLGEPVDAPAISVFDVGTLNLSTVFSDDLATPTPLANPFVGTTDGLVQFYAANGRYDIAISGGTPAVAVPYTLGDRTLGLGDAGVESYAFASLPASGAPSNTGRLARVTNTSRGLWMDTGTFWFSLTGEWFNVREFGAVGDGVANDTVAVQAAADAADAAGGGVVYFPRGTYLIKQVTLGSNTRATGAGWASILARQDGTTNFLFRNKDTVGGDANIIIDNLAFDGLSATDPNTGFQKYGLRFTRVTGLIISHCFVHDSTDGGILIDGACQRVLIDANLIRNNSLSNAVGETNVALVECTDVLVANNTIDGPTERAGLDIEPNPAQIVDRITVDGNLFLNCGKSGVVVTTSTGDIRRIVVQNNTLINCNTGPFPNDGAIQCDPAGTQAGTPTFHCLNNVIDGSDRDGIRVSLGAVVSANALAVIAGNIIRDIGQGTDDTFDGIQVLLDRDTVVANNVISSVAANKHRYGINVIAQVAASIRQMHGNVISDAQTADVNQQADPNDQTLTPFYQKPQFSGPNATGAASAILAGNAPALASTTPFTWVDVVAADGTRCTMPIWRKS